MQAYISQFGVLLLGLTKHGLYFAGKTTVNSRYGTKVAVLAGDFLFAQSSYYLAHLDNLEVTIGSCSYADAARSLIPRRHPAALSHAIDKSLFSSQARYLVLELPRGYKAERMGFPDGQLGHAGHQADQPGHSRFCQWGDQPDWELV